VFLRPDIFHAHVLYRKVLVSLQSSAVSLAISRKNTQVEAFLLRKILHAYDYPDHFRLKFQQSLSKDISHFILIYTFFLLSHELETLKFWKCN